MPRVWNADKRECGGHGFAVQRNNGLQLGLGQAPCLVREPSPFKQELRQDIVFDGDWNGGYRGFRVRTMQRLDFERIVRIERYRPRRVVIHLADVTIAIGSRARSLRSPASRPRRQAPNRPYGHAP
jgi:hypothetical protein